MAKCLFCYQPLEESLYHKKCCKKFFGYDTLPELILNNDLLAKLAKETVNKRISLTGVQPKLSIDVENIAGTKRLTIVGLWGKYILKPQNGEIAQMPEAEDLTMHLANLFGIKTCDHCLIPTSNGDLVYLAKRFDRVDNIKIHLEDFCQLGEFQTEQKYDSSYERCGKLITTHCTNSRLDVINYFELLLFSFLSGNNDMHMKNFSIMHLDQGIVLSPAYDLINSHLIYPKDKEDMALLLNGRKSKIKLKDFQMLSGVLGIREKVFDRILKKFNSATDKVFHLIDHSFLSESYKETYKMIWENRLKRLE
ncbi:toxin HipA [Pedobacter steynii]|uniref:Toxin HipA n=1 Tax=Pedobacter steynii TaxID=430522 RepID=A0A1D7QDW2_9SPHI|nr:toxin HipA [Pedobacter steynii]